MINEILSHYIQFEIVPHHWVFLKYYFSSNLLTHLEHDKITFLQFKNTSLNTVYLKHCNIERCSNFYQSIHPLIFWSINLSIHALIFLPASVMAAAICSCPGQRHAGLPHGSYCLPHGLPCQPFWRGCCCEYTFFQINENLQYRTDLSVFRERGKLKIEEILGMLCVDCT